MQSIQNPAAAGRRCCLCGEDQFSLLSKWEAEHPRNSATIPLSVWECRCGLAMLHPVPSPDQLPHHGDWWSDQRRFIVRHQRLKQIRRKLQDLVFGGKRERFVRHTRKAVAGGKLLDIGCGHGELLSIAREWYDCEGVEPSNVAADECRKLGFCVRLGMFEDIDLAAATYDVAVMDSVLEHVHDPVQILQKVNTVLRPGGVIAIKVPKLWGLAHRRHGREWNGFRVGYHTFLFTGATLSRTLQAAGFDVLSSPKRDRPLDDLLALWGRKRQDVGSELLNRAA